MKLYNQNLGTFPNLSDKVFKQIKHRCDNGTSWGTLDNDGSLDVELNHVCCTVTDLERYGDTLYGTLNILDTDNGKLVKALINADVSIGICARALRDKNIKRRDIITRIFGWDLFSKQCNCSVIIDTNHLDIII